MSADPTCRRWALWCGFLACLGFLQACDPPGKPKAEPENENREQIVDFATLYSSNCSGCHGAEGDQGAARGLNDPLYLAVLPRETLKQILVKGRPGTAMPAWAESQGGPLTDKQIDTLVDGIYRNWAKPSQFTGQALPAYVSTTTGDAQNGKQLFTQDCAPCHGKGAPVGSVTNVTYASLSSDEYMRSTIIAGRSDLGMPNYRTLNRGKALSEQNISDLVAYLASFRPAAITATMQSGDSSKSGEQAGPSGSHENENGTGKNQTLTKGNEGSGNGPGTPRPQQRSEGNKGKGSSSQQGVK